MITGDTIKVTVSGPGRTFCEIPYIIEKALREAGVQVTVDNDHLPTCSEDVLIREAKRAKVHIKVDHQPWGG